MVQPVTKYAASDGKEFARVTEAEAHDFFLKVEKIMLRNAYSGYSSGYDGPMPSVTAKLESIGHYRQELRHLFLEIDPPEPVIIHKTNTVVERTFPHWLIPVSIYCIGLACGWAWF